MMKKASEFDNILDECLERVIRGESVEACLESHPEHAAELEPLLRTAVDTMQAVAITPRKEFRERASRQFQGAIREMAPPESRGFFGWFPRWAAAVSVIVIVLLAGTGIVAAAEGSLPDSPLYALKLATETVRLGFTTSDIDKAELYVKLTDERVDEIIQMAESGKVDQVEQTAERLNDQLIAMADLGVTSYDGAVGEGKGATFEAPRMQAAETPPTEEAAAPAPAPVPAPTAALPPKVTAEEEPEIIASEAPGEGDEAPVDINTLSIEGLEGPEKLRVLVMIRSETNIQALRELLEQVPESVRQSIQDAIDIIETGYGQVLLNLE